MVVVFFGFTQCPDVCPTSMAELAQVKKLLGADGDKLQAIFITVDPERDTPELLKAYMGNFDPAFLALRPTMAQPPEVAKDFKVYYKRSTARPPAATPWTTPRAATSSTARAACACTTATAAARKRWRRTSGCC